MRGGKPPLGGIKQPGSFSPRKIGSFDLFGELSSKVTIQPADHRVIQPSLLNRDCQEVRFGSFWTLVFKSDFHIFLLYAFTNQVHEFSTRLLPIPEGPQKRAGKYY